MITYFATVVARLEQILSNEIEEKVPTASIELTLRGKVFFCTKSRITHFNELRTANNIYEVLDSFWIGPHRMHLKELSKRIFDLSLSKRMGNRSYYVNASRSGKHTYSRFEAAESAMQAIKDRNPRSFIGSPKEHDLEFRLDIEDARATFSLRVTDVSFR